MSDHAKLYEERIEELERLLKEVVSAAHDSEDGNDFNLWVIEDVTPEVEKLVGQKRTEWEEEDDAEDEVLFFSEDEIFEAAKKFLKNKYCVDATAMKNWEAGNGSEGAWITFETPEDGLIVLVEIRDLEDSSDWGVSFK